jgi:hypothetical protein
MKPVITQLVARPLLTGGAYGGAALAASLISVNFAGFEIVSLDAVQLCFAPTMLSYTSGAAIGMLDGVSKLVVEENYLWSEEKEEESEKSPEESQSMWSFNQQDFSKLGADLTSLMSEGNIKQTISYGQRGLKAAKWVTNTIHRALEPQWVPSGLRPLYRFVANLIYTVDFALHLKERIEALGADELTPKVLQTLFRELVGERIEELKSRVRKILAGGLVSAGIGFTAYAINKKIKEEKD